jgi:hypothetical protein
VTLALTAAWGGLLLVMIIQLPERARTVALVSLIYPAYYAILSFVLHSRRRTTSG